MQIAATESHTYFMNVWRNYVFPGDIVSDHNGIFTIQHFKDCYFFPRIARSVSMAFCPQTDGLTKVPHSSSQIIPKS